MQKKFLSILLLITLFGIFGFYKFSIFELRAASEINQAAVNYIKSEPQNPWITMALAVAGESPDSSYLKNVSGDSAISLEAPILAITAVRKDPRVYPDYDYIAKLKSFWDGNQLGDQNLFNDDIFGILALISGGESLESQIIIGLKNYLVSKQNQDGGWGWAPGVNSDTNMTAMAMMALLSAEVSDQVIARSVQYLKTAQNEDGGFPYDPQSPWGTNSDASSDSWVISAIFALGQNPEVDWVKNSSNPISHLKSLQNPQGGFFQNTPGAGETSFSPTETAYAVIALAGKYYPINTITFTTTVTQFDFRIEGSKETVCEDKIEGPTALDVIKNAAKICNFDYEIVETSFGPYLKRINEDTAAGLTGWLYFVNYISPDIGAADYILKLGDSVIWYFGEWGWPPTKTEVQKTEDKAIVTVQYFDGINWKSLEGATVKIGDTQFLTDASGKAEITLSVLAPGFYKIFAEKQGYIRSNKADLIFGEGESEGVGLKVTISQIQQEEDFISFSVTPDEIDFGILKPGEKNSRDVIVTNSGVNIRLEAQVTGAAIFTENIDIEENFWQQFVTEMNKQESKIFPVELEIPGNYSGGFGAKTGELIFWATKL